MKRFTIKWGCDNCAHTETEERETILEAKDWCLCPVCHTHHWKIKYWSYNYNYVHKIEEINRELYKHLAYYRRFMPDILEMKESEYNRTREAQNVNKVLDKTLEYMKVEIA